MCDDPNERESEACCLSFNIAKEGRACVSLMEDESEPNNGSHLLVLTTAGHQLFCERALAVAVIGLPCGSASEEHALPWAAGYIPDQTLLYIEHSHHTAVSPGFKPVLHFSGELSSLPSFPILTSISSIRCWPVASQGTSLSISWVSGMQFLAEGQPEPTLSVGSAIISG